MIVKLLFSTYFSDKVPLRDVIDSIKKGDLSLVEHLPINTTLRHVLSDCYTSCEYKSLARVSMRHSHGVARRAAMTSLHHVLMIKPIKLTPVTVPTLLTMEKILRPRDVDVLASMCQKDTRLAETYIEVYQVILSYVYIAATAVIPHRSIQLVDLAENKCKGILDVLHAFGRNVHVRFPSRKHCFRFEFLKELLGQNSLLRQVAKLVDERKICQRVSLLGKLHQLMDSTVESAAHKQVAEHILQAYTKMAASDHHAFYLYTCFLVGQYFFNIP